MFGQNYDWGRIGYDSRVARLFQKNSSGTQIDESKHYAEFWISTHVSGPSFLVNNNNLSLKTWILQNPMVLGDVVLHKWGRDLPFLLKVFFFVIMYLFLWNYRPYFSCSLWLITLD